MLRNKGIRDRLQKRNFLRVKMLVRVSPNLSLEERETVTHALQELAPEARVCDTGTPIFQVVRHSDFDSHPDPNIPSVTPCALTGFLSHGAPLPLRQFPPHGFLNLHLHLKRICVTGFSRDERAQVKHMIQIMGGIAESQLVKQTHFLIAKDAFSRRIPWAQQHQIPVVTKAWLIELSRSQDFVSHTPFIIKVLDGVTFAATKFTLTDERHLADSGAAVGGRFGRRMNFTNQFLVVPDHVDMGTSQKVRLAVALRIPMITAGDFCDFVAGRKEESFLRDEPACTGNVFRNISFRVDEQCYSSDNVKQMLNLNGARLTNGTCDFRVLSWGRGNSDRVRTPVWVERCIVEQKILDANACPWYIPSARKSHDTKGVIISISGFSASQKLDIVSALKWNRIPYSPTLTRECTTLVAMRQGTPKVRTALEWKIPVVSLDWLIAFIRGDDCDIHNFLLVEPAPPVPSKPTRCFLDDEDDEDFMIEATALIDQQIMQPKSTRASPLRHRSPSCAVSPSKPFVFLCDSDDDYLSIDPDVDAPAAGPVKLASSPKRESGAKTRALTPDEILSAAKTVKDYHKPRRIRRTPDVEQIESWYVCTQRPPVSDDETMTVGYVDDEAELGGNDMHDDPLLLQL